MQGNYEMVLALIIGYEFQIKTSVRPAVVYVSDSVIFLMCASSVIICCIWKIFHFYMKKKKTLSKTITSSVHLLPDQSHR